MKPVTFLIAGFFSLLLRKSLSKFQQNRCGKLCCLGTRKRHDKYLWLQNG